MALALPRLEHGVTSDWEGSQAHRMARADRQHVRRDALREEALARSAGRLPDRDLIVLLRSVSATDVCAVHQHADACRSGSRRSHSRAADDRPPGRAPRDASNAGRRCRPSDPRLGALNG